MSYDIQSDPEKNIPSVFDVVSDAPDFEPNRRWELVISNHAEYAEPLLLMAERARKEGLDPGDVLLASFALGYVVKAEEVDRAEFTRIMASTESTSDSPSPQGEAA